MVVITVSTLFVTILLLFELFQQSRKLCISLKECARKLKFMIFCTFMFPIIAGLIAFSTYKSQCTSYNELYPVPIQGDSTVASFDKYGVHLTVGSGQKYTLTPEQMCFYDFVEYTKKGYKIEKKSDTDTIYLIRGSDRVSVTMKRPKF